MREDHTPDDDNPGGADSGGRTRAKRAARPRNAATLILWRARGAETEILMGRRHAKARFMPNALVFPGGVVDRADHRAKTITELAPEPRAMLERQAPPSLARALAVAAVRELFEETGLALGERSGSAVKADLAPIEYLCRAVTPPSRPIRFNARFLIAPGDTVSGGFAGSGELDAIGWYTLEQAQADRLAPITAKVLAEFHAWRAMSAAERSGRALVLFRGNDNRMVEG